MSEQSDDAYARELREQVDWALKELEKWPDKEYAILDQMPGPCLCPECYLDGTDPQGDHWVIVLCPRATGFMTVYRQKDKLRNKPVGEPDGKLHPDTKYAMDATAMPQTIMGLIDNIYKKREQAEKAEGDRNGHDEGERTY
ncbi:MAG: hypothetical protein IH921_05030 [Gemmatimonadetes bacterium]|nr:hypothetical protein [Gemmatimonadota bacterium]